jgi:hypothetical protein
LGWYVADGFSSRQNVNQPAASAPLVMTSPPATTLSPTVVQQSAPSNVDDVFRTIEKLVAISNRGDRSAFESAISAAIEQHHGDERAQSSIRDAAAGCLNERFHDQDAAAKLYRQAAQDASTMLITAANLRTTAYSHLAECVRDTNLEEALQAYRRVIETFERLDTFPMLPHDTPPSESRFQKCRQTYSESISELARLSEPAMKEVGYVSPVAYRHFPPAMDKKMVWLSCYEANSLMRTRRNLLILDSEYQSDDEEKKRRTSETLQAAAAIIENVIRERSDANLELSKDLSSKPSRMQLRSRMQNEDLRLLPANNQ